MYTSRNLGDAAIVREVMRNIALRRPDCEFIAINRDPEDAVNMLGIAAFPSEGYGPAFLSDGSPWQKVDHPGPKWLSRGLGTRRIVAVLRSLDLLVMSGGGQVEDFFGGAASQPRVLLTWSGLARLFGIPVAYFSVGVDQVLDSTSRLLAVNAIRLGSMRSFRDRGSVRWLRDAGLRAPCRVDPDPALGLDVRGLVMHAPGRRSVVVVSPISFRTWTRDREDSYEAYLQVLARACDIWVGEGRVIRFVCSDISMDPPVANEVISRMSSGARRSSKVSDVRTTDQFLQQVADACVLVGSRLHALILAVAAGIPVIAVSPARKVTQFMDENGLSDFCVDMSSVTSEQLTRLQARVEADQDHLRRRVAEISRSSRAQLASAYSDLVGLLPPRSGID